MNPTDSHYRYPHSYITLDYLPAGPITTDSYTRHAHLLLQLPLPSPLPADPIRGFCIGPGRTRLFPDLPDADRLDGTPPP